VSPYEVQQALRTVIHGHRGAGSPDSVRFGQRVDDIAVWSTIWGAEQHLVCRLCHLDRIVEQRVNDSWQRVSVQQAVTGTGLGAWSNGDGRGEGGTTLPQTARKSRPVSPPARYA